MLGQSEVNRHNSLFILCNITLLHGVVPCKLNQCDYDLYVVCVAPYHRNAWTVKKIGREQLNIWNIYGLVLQIILEIQGPCGLITEQVLLAYIEIMGGPHFQWNVLQRKKKSTKYSFPSAFLFFFKVWYPLYTFPHCVYALEFIWRWFNEQSDSRICFIIANTKTKWHVSDKIFTRHVGNKINKKIWTTTDRITCICEWASGYLQPWNSYKGYNEKIHFDDCAD